MRIISFLIVLGALTAAAHADSTQGGAVPVFEPDYTTNWLGGVIHADNRGAVPEAVDWDGDGAKDLLVGVFYNGNVWYYRNYGTNSAPLFQGRSMVQAGGANIALSYG